MTSTRDSFDRATRRRCARTGSVLRAGVLLVSVGALIALPACSSNSGVSRADSVQFAGSWLCNFTLTQIRGGISTYPPSPVKTVVTGGTSLGINDEESDSEPQSWFCGFNYAISGSSAMLVGMPTCESYDSVALQSATISLSEDGNKLTLQESGRESGFDSTELSTITGTCARN
jgi:hypothetical protein